MATTIRLTGDWDLAEDAAAGAFEKATTTWPRDGVPRNPGAWLTTAARNLATDRLRRHVTEKTKLREWLTMDVTTPEDPAAVVVADPALDDRLRLLFTCAHPALPLDARVALTLRTVGGLATSEVARAFFVSEQTMAQRIVRAKRKIAHAGIPYRVPPPHALPQRLDGVLAVLYLIYNEGYAASSGSSLQRHDLATEAIRLTRLLRTLMPEPEVDGLLALMLLQHARSAARIDAAGDLVPLEDQDRSLWDSTEIAEGLGLLAGRPRTGRGPYRVQAEIQAVHARAATAAGTDWPTICDLYSELPASAIVELNRAIAVGMAQGPVAGLSMLADLEASGELAGYHLLPAARADLSRRAGWLTEAAALYRAAIALAPTEPERRFLDRRLASLR
ncbi:MAG: RNA polymerase sigma factor [Propionibacteriaceae bacterium]